MKLIAIAYNMFRQHIKLNLMLIIELSITLLIMVYAINAYTINNTKVDILQNAKNGYYYWSFPAKISDIDNYFENPDNDKVIKLQQLKNFTKDKPWIIGVSDHDDSYIILNKEIAEKNLAPEYDQVGRVCLYDEVTLENFHYPLSEGRWFDPLPKLQEGHIPCVIGGGLAAKYEVGDIITGYENRIPKSNLPLVENRFIVIGKLRKPEYILALNNTVYIHDSDKTHYWTPVFNPEITDSLLMISPISMVNRSLGKSKQSKIDSEIVYYDKKATSGQVQKLGEFLNQGYSLDRKDLIAITSSQRDETIYTFGTVFILMFSVSFVGLVSMCILTTIKSIEKFKIYYLVGAAKIKTVAITLVFALYFLVSSGLLFALLLLYAYNADTIIFPSYYFELYPNTILGLVFVMVPIVVCSFLLPFLEISRTNIINLLKK
jgi:hypothetical protein